MNLIFDIDLDAKGGNPSLKLKSISRLLKLLDTLDTCDIFRVRYPNRKRFSFRQKSPRKEIIHRRLDYIFVPNELQEFVTKIDILPSFLSDHSPILIIVDLFKDGRHGRGYWKLNNSIIFEEEYCVGIRNAIKNYTDSNPNENPHIVWETIKYEARKFSIRYSKNRKNKKNVEKLKHENIVKQFESNIPPVPKVGEYEDSKIWLDAWYDDFTTGAMLRSKTDWYEKGEKSSKFFLNLEKSNSVKNTIRLLSVAEKTGEVLITDRKKILNHSKNFYENLFSRKIDKSCEDCHSFLANVNTPVLSPLQLELCDKLLTIDELFDSLSSMHSGKSPGNDGLSVEFYKKFWDVLKIPLYKSVIYSKIHGALSTSQRQAIIKLLEKKEKDKRFIQNWRPISLLNVDTKIITKAFANRLKMVLPDLISYDQTAYVNGRFIGESCRLISDILEITKNFDIGGYILTADIEKAFDSMDHNFLLAVLEKFGFGPYFVSWIKVLLNKNESCVVNGGTASSYFELKRGARQGDPIAAYLFILTLEIFFIIIRDNKDLNKLKIFDHTFLLSAYADDTTFFVQDIESVNNIFELFHQFSSFSGFKLNHSKCELCGIGALKGVKTALCNVKNVNLEKESIKILGIYYTYNKKVHIEKKL